MAWTEQPPTASRSRSGQPSRLGPVDLATADTPDEAVFAAVHERLAELLPGTGPLAGRYQRWRNSMLVPAEQVESAMAAVIIEARAQTCDLVELPAGEGVVMEAARDAPWHGRVTVNVGLLLAAQDPGSPRNRPAS